MFLLFFFKELWVRKSKITLYSRIEKISKYILYNEIQVFAKGKITNKARRKATINPVYGLELDVSVMNSKAHTHIHTPSHMHTLSLTHRWIYICIYIHIYM